MRKMKRQICIEETVSRIPSLFAYYDYNELGEITIHKATDSIDGSYGKMVCGIKVPFNLTFGDDVILPIGSIVSYRTLMNHYYEAINSGIKPNNNDTLITFVNNAIGKIDIKVRTETDTQGNVFYFYRKPDNEKIYFDVNPVKIIDTLYISQAKKMYDEMVKNKILCTEFWREQETENVKEAFETKEVCCVCNDYNERGGNGMVEILLYWLSRAEEIAEEYLGYVSTENDIFKVNVCLVNTYNDPGYYTPYLINWKPGYYLAPNEKFIYEDENGVMQMYQNGDTSYYGSYDTDNERPTFDSTDVTKVNEYWDNEENIEITEQTDSKLSSLRRFTSYINIFNEQEKPEQNEDWLYYYCKDFVLNIKTKNDTLGNIGFYGDGTPETDGEYVTNLIAYGDMITDIHAENGEITFTYVIGAHLKGLKADNWGETDDDDNLIYVYKSFEIDTDSEYSKNCGVFYTETYYYDEDGELDELLKPENVDYYNKYITNEENVRRFDSKKYSFNTGNSSESYEMRVDTKSTEINYLTTNLSYVKDNTRDIFSAKIFKEDYLMGIHFKPYVEDNVDIDRGKNAAFERHIKLGEVKTLQDLENYQNGGFFNIKIF